MSLFEIVAYATSNPLVAILCYATATVVVMALIADVVVKIVKEMIDKMF